MLSQEDRRKFDRKIEQVIKACYVKDNNVETTGRFADFSWMLIETYLLRSHILCRGGNTNGRYIDDLNQDVNGPVFDTIINQFVVKLSPKNLDLVSEELNYILSSIVRGLLGDGEGIPIGKYCLRAYFKGALLWILNDLVSGYFDLKYYFMLQGVIIDVIDSTKILKSKDSK